MYEVEALSSEVKVWCPEVKVWGLVVEVLEVGGRRSESEEWDTWEYFTAYSADLRADRGHLSRLCLTGRRIDGTGDGAEGGIVIVCCDAIARFKVTSSETFLLPSQV